MGIMNVTLTVAEDRAHFKTNSSNVTVEGRKATFNPPTNTSTISVTLVEGNSVDFVESNFNLPADTPNLTFSPNPALLSNNKYVFTCVDNLSNQTSWGYSTSLTIDGTALDFTDPSMIFNPPG